MICFQLCIKKVVMLIKRDEKWLYYILHNYYTLREMAICNSNIDALIELDRLHDVVNNSGMTTLQARRTSLFSKGYSIGEIAEIESVAWPSVQDSIYRSIKRIIKKMKMEGDV